MALANIGVWLAQNGRRVLLVDFDLEAPGLCSYALPNLRSDRKGVVDYLYEARENNTPRTLEDFYFQSFTGKDGGALYVMPAGRASSFHERLSQIDLEAMYEDQGYLILENLKSLWKDEIAPDYVLIDSRTGYNEVSGICTRQLPNSVVAMFVPSPQNVSGLKEIVGQIRAQNAEGWAPQIGLHFLASNIPFVDDERGEVAAALDTAKQELGFEELLGTIFHFPSTSHLSHHVFTLDRENSLLAKAYGEVARALTMQSPDDAVGASLLLDRIINRDAPVASIVEGSLDDALINIEQRHRDNPEVLFKLARLRFRQGLEEEALTLLNDVLEKDPLAVDARLLRASLLRQTGLVEASANDAREVLGQAGIDVINVSRAIQTLTRSSSPEVYSELSSFVGFAALSAEDKAAVLKTLSNAPAGRPQVIPQIEVLLESEQLPAGLEDSLRSEVILERIHQSRFDDAMKMIGKRPGKDASLFDMFNYALAEWGSTGIVPHDLLEHVCSRYEEVGTSLHDPANFYQCVALAHAALGNFEKALQLVGASRQRAARSSRSHMSCLTYEVLDRDDFIKHLDLMFQQFSEHTVNLPLLNGSRNA